MRFALSALLATFCAAALVLTAANASVFDRVPEDHPAYEHIALLGSAGLIDDFELPVGELSRLEMAVLIQRGLAAYGSGQLDGGEIAPVVEDALAALLEEFEGDLLQLGTQPVATIRRADPEPATENNAEIECDVCSADQLEVCVHGDFRIQAQSFSTEHVSGASTEYGDVAVYWGEIRWDVAYENWTSRFSFLLDTNEEAVELLEAWGQYTNPNSGLFFQLGQIVLPFSNNAHYFPTYPAVRDLGYTRARALGAGLKQDNFGLAAYAFNPVVDGINEQEQVDEFSVVLDLTVRKATACQNGWQLTGGYTTHLPEHDLRLAGGGPVNSAVAAYNLFGRYDWGGNRYHLLADYTAALDEYNLAELDTDGDGVGDKPSAFNFEFVYEPQPDMLWGVSYQLTDEFTDYADERMGLMYGERLNRLVMMKLEYTHGEYGAFVTDTQAADDTFVAEFNFTF